MAAPRKNPPAGAKKIIEDLASHGATIIGIARSLGVSRETFKRWCDEENDIQESFDLGRETLRQSLIALIVQAAVANKGANANAMFLLKTMFGFREFDSPNSKVDVNVQVTNPVMVVRDLGSVEDWQAKAKAQQQGLIANNVHPAPRQLEVATTAQESAEEVSGPSVYLPPVYAPQAVPVATEAAPAPSWQVPSYTGQLTIAPPAPAFAPSWKAKS